VNIRFTSTLTQEDENKIAPALLQALSAIMDLLPITYVLEIETSDLQTYQHGGFGHPPILGNRLVEPPDTAGPVPYES